MDRATDPIRRASRSPSGRLHQGRPGPRDPFGAGMMAALLGSRVLREGDAGSAVREVQRSLVQLGHAIEASGRFDPATKEAVIAFQSRHGLEAHGTVDRRTAAALDVALARPA